MKKSLIALAVASAVAAPAAFAATSNVDIYGIFGAAVDIIDRDNASEDEFKVSSTASRIGFKGAEDLGGGLSAIWQVETGVNIDTGGGNWGSRNTFVGLSSKSLGTVRLGNYDTAYKLSTGRLDVFGDTLADYNTIMGSADSSNALFDRREPNSISYESPVFSGLTLMGTYGQQNEGGSTFVDSELWALAAVYANGPLFATFAYETLNDFGVSRDIDTWKIGAGYKFGNTTLGAVYESMDDDLANSVATRDAWYLSVRHDMGNIALKGAYANADDSDAGNDGADFWALGVDYGMSKRTVVYALYTSLDNESAANFTLGSSGTTGAQASGNGTNPNGLSIGLKHSF
jgi:predicted porin